MNQSSSMTNDKLKKQLQSLRPSFRKAIAPTIVATLIFFITYFFFGMENTMIGPFATLAFLRYRTMHNHYECMIKNYVIYAIMAVLCYFAVMNLPLCIILNAAGLFWIAHFTIDEYNPNNYFATAMALIFFQIAPVYTPAALFNRLGALGATFLIVFVFVFILSKMDKNKEPLLSYINEGFDNCRKQLELCHSGKNNPDISENLDLLHHELCEINRNISGDIYSFNRATLRKHSKANWYCHFILVFQILNFLTQNHTESGFMDRASTLYNDFRREYETVIPQPTYHRLNFRLRKPDIRSFRLRFALRQVITITPCLVFAWAVNLPNVYWLVISVYFMMIPFTDHTKQRVKQRILGTIAGILVCLGLFFLFQGFPARVVIMTIANFLIYGASGYGATVTYITCSALALQTLNGSITATLLLRLLYTLIGAVIALIANRFIFPIRIRYQISYLTEMICNLRYELIDITNQLTEDVHRRRKELDQRIVKSYLLMKRLEDLCHSLPKESLHFDFEAFEREHMNAMAEYMSQYLTHES